MNDQFFKAENLFLTSLNHTLCLIHHVYLITIDLIGFRFYDFPFIMRMPEAGLLPLIAEFELVFFKETNIRKSSYAIEVVGEARQNP